MWLLFSYIDTNYSAGQTVLFWVSLGDSNPSEGRLWLREPERCAAHEESLCLPPLHSSCTLLGNSLAADIISVRPESERISFYPSSLLFSLSLRLPFALCQDSSASSSHWALYTHTHTHTHRLSGEAERRKHAPCVWGRNKQGVGAEWSQVRIRKWEDLVSLWVNEREFVWIEAALARGTGASDRTQAWNQRRFRGKEAPVGVLVRLYSTHSADRRKILYALLDFLALHERAGDGLSLSARHWHKSA